ncbi:MAG: hypothetical protein R3C03_07415 [Pirellulaceae bacterium]
MGENSDLQFAGKEVSVYSPFAKNGIRRYDAVFFDPKTGRHIAFEVKSTPAEFAKNNWQQMNADSLLNSSGGRAVIGDESVVVTKRTKFFGKLLDNRMNSDRSIFDTFRAQFAEQIQSFEFLPSSSIVFNRSLIFRRPFHDDFKHSIEFQLKGGVKRPKSSFKIIGVWLNIWCTSLDEFWPPVLESRNSLELNSPKYSRLIVANTALHILNNKTPVLYSMDFSSYAHVTPNCDILLHELCERGMPFLNSFQT